MCGTPGKHTNSYRILTWNFDTSPYKYILNIDTYQTFLLENVGSRFVPYTGNLFKKKKQFFRGQMFASPVIKDASFNIH